jgi:hypothetical protein
MMSFMSVYFNAPFTDEQLKKLQQYQDNSPEPLTCLNGNCHNDPMRTPALYPTNGGLVCPDINCASVVTSVPDYIINGRFKF